MTLPRSTWTRPEPDCRRRRALQGLCLRRAKKMPSRPVSQVLKMLADRLPGQQRRGGAACLLAGAGRLGLAAHPGRQFERPFYATSGGGAGDARNKRWGDHQYRFDCRARPRLKDRLRMWPARAA